jgi:peptidoglycan/LPS O-acetylase OafA/YrhL
VSHYLVPIITLANFLAAFGGGTILGKAVGVFKHEPLLKGDSLLALLLGGALVVILNPQVSGRRIAQYFGFIAAGCSGLLYLTLLVCGESDLLQLNSRQLCIWVAVFHVLALGCLSHQSKNRSVRTTSTAGLEISC